MDRLRSYDHEVAPITDLGSAPQDFVDLLRPHELAFYAMSLLDIGGVRPKQRIALLLRYERSEGYDGAHDLTTVGAIGKEIPYGVGAVFDRSFPPSKIPAGIPSDDLLNIRSELRQTGWREPRRRAQTHFKR
jgi:hypothetical protein